MTFILILILIVALWWICRPMIHAWLIRQAQKRMENFFRAAAGQADPYAEKRRQSHRQTYEEQDPFFGPFGTRRRRSGKKIDPNVGEYVEFEEIKTAPHKPDIHADNVKFTPESQIEDADWEDIK